METAAKPKKTWLQTFLQDARHFQVVYLFLFLLFGLLELGWDQDIPKYSILLGTALGTQAIFIRLTKKDLTSLKSALITALGLCLLLKANSLPTLALAASLAIASKFLIRYRGKHVFNPANFGIIITLLLTNDAWVSPGQWGSDVILLYFFGAAALMVLLKVGRIDTSLAFLGVYFGAEFIRSYLYLGWPMDYFTHQITNGTILLFAFFMVTDPRTTPNSMKGRIIWGAFIGLIAFSMRVWFHQHSAPLWALFFISPLTILLDRILPGKPFNWT